ncbi:MAG: glycoside hydrolase family 16 protein [Clostridia bacterium]|nr:glycoside hydrolase family 16 protein [Clostridia bacterium]
MKFAPLMKGLWALLLSLVLMLPAGSFPRVPHEKELTLVWSDEFDGDCLDTAKWRGHYTAAEATVRRGSYWSTEMAAVKDGMLHIQTQYLPEGLNGNGKPGWYTCGIDTNGLYEQTFGYFEVRCILPKGCGMWSAFWMLSNTMGQVGNGGEDGAEIDIFESPFYGERFSRRVSSNIHIDGYGADLKSSHVCESYLLLNDPYENFNTYGLEWNETEYIFYVNGVEMGRSSFGGTAKVPEYLILSVEVGGENAVPGDSWAGKALAQDDAPTDFVIDYVRAYQYNAAQ